MASLLVRWPCPVRRASFTPYTNAPPPNRQSRRDFLRSGRPPQNGSVAVELRRVVEADLPAVGSVQVAAALAGFAHIFPPEAPKPAPEAMAEDWRVALFGPDAVGRAGFVALEGGRPIGVVLAGPLSGEPGVGQLARLYVDPEHWASGVGRLLYDAALGHLEAQGCTRARLKVLERNQRARRWYERLGWRPTGELDLMFEEYGIVEVVYGKDLFPDGSIASG